MDAAGRISADAVERIARDVWSIDARAQALAGEEDRNFLLVTADGDRFVLKSAPPSTRREGIECQVLALDHLAGSPLAELVPRVVLTVAAQRLCHLDFGDGPSWTRVVTYLDGTPLVNRGDRPPWFLEGIGRTLARLDLALADFGHPGTERDIPWNLERTSTLDRHLEHIGDTARQRLVAQRLEEHAVSVEPLLSGFEHGVIHNDPNDHNLLVKDGSNGRPELAGLIDFGDLLHTVTIADLAIACAYLMLDREQPLADAACVIAGYDAVRPLAPAEQALIYDLILARLCSSVLVSAYRRHLYPDDEYLQISAQPVWRLLERLAAVEPGRARDRLVEGCRSAAAPRRNAAEIMKVRRRHLGRNLSTAYSEPLKIVRGEGQYLFDEGGRRYLDLVNNVCHVGHCHPRVVAAAHHQMAELNTNTRYLHDNLAEYAVRLAAAFPDPLEVCFFVCTGTEANDLALRLARARTGSKEIIVLDHAYHGHSPSLVEISPYKCDGPGGEGLAPHARKVPMPDPYRGPHRGEDAGERYAGAVRDAIAAISGAGGRPGAFMAESLIGCGGQVVPAAGFLAAATGAVREAGGVTIADEVQVGFGRVGTHWWAFQPQGVVPDIVTLGKPIGNGHPLAAVITTPEIAASFDTGMEYFNTFGGNPVSCAVGLAVLDVIEEEGLQAHALEVGNHLADGLRQLQQRHQLIGDVRGLGLFIGVELVRDRDTLEPADTEASRVIDDMKTRGFLLSTDGPLHNVLKIKPPMVIQRHDVDEMLQALDEVLNEPS